MQRSLVLALIICLAEAAGFAQGLSGKWATDRPADSVILTDAQRKQSARLEVFIEDAGASATLTVGGLGGTFYVFKDGKLSGNTLQFLTDNPEAGPPTTWTIELADENTVTISRCSEFPVVGNAEDLRSILPGGVLIRATEAPTAVATPGGPDTSISGSVRDPSRALIPGVTVTATNVDTGVKSTAVTSAAGVYVFPGVIPGNYTISASLSGFQTAATRNLRIGETPFVQDFTLKVLGFERCHALWRSVLHRTN